MTSGQPLFGRPEFGVPEPVPVIYFAAEVGDRAFKQRVQKFGITNDKTKFLCRTVCQGTVDAINARRAAGQGIARADYIKLGELGNPIFKGTTHMLMMLGTNNLEVADVILNWVEANVPPRKQNGKNKELISAVSTKK